MTNWFRRSPTHGGTTSERRRNVTTETTTPEMYPPVRKYTWPSGRRVFGHFGRLISKTFVVKAVSDDRTFFPDRTNRTRETSADLLRTLRHVCMLCTLRSLYGETTRYVILRTIFTSKK